MTKQKFYAVKIGETPGIYYSWEDCQNQVHGYPGAKFKSFDTLEEAGEFMKDEKTYVNEQADVFAESMQHAIAYVDGSYNQNTREYGSGVALFWQGEEIHLVEKGNDEALVDMRNVAGEIRGSQLAMQYCVAHHIPSVIIVHDYQGISSWCKGEWKTNKVGTIAYKNYYDSIKSIVDIKFQKVKGHSGDRWNDLADQLAKSAIF